jgi:fructokinase
MNDAEVPTVLTTLGIPGEDEAVASKLRSGAQRLLAEFPDVQMVAITRGGHGSILIRRDEWDEHPGIPTRVADTIGAGDAFTAAMTHYLLRGADLPALNEAGNRWGSWMAAQSGAMPVLPDGTRAGIAAAIEDRA